MNALKPWKWLKLLNAWSVFTSAVDLIEVEVEDESGNVQRTTRIPYSYYENIEAKVGKIEENDEEEGKRFQKFNSRSLKVRPENDRFHH